MNLESDDRKYPTLKGFVADIKASMVCDGLIGKRPIHFLRYIMVAIKEEFILKGDWDI